MRPSLFKFVNSIGRAVSGRGLGLERMTWLKALYDSFYKKVAPVGVVLVEAQGNRIYVNAHDEPLGRALITQGVYEAYETQLFKAQVRSGMTVVDIGANVGYYTLIAAGLVGESGRVYSFEPDPGNYDLLARNVKLNGYNNVMTHQKAVSNCAGVVTLYIDSKNFGNRSFGKSNILSGTAAVEVETVSLDDFCRANLNGRNIDVMKVDAQGAEALIIAGGRRTLRQHKPKVFMEFEPEMLRNLGADPVSVLGELRALGFEVGLINPGNSTVSPATDEQLLEKCKGTGYVDLFLEPNSMAS